MQEWWDKDLAELLSEGLKRTTFWVSSCLHSISLTNHSSTFDKDFDSSSNWWDFGSSKLSLYPQELEIWLKKWLHKLKMNEANFRLEKQERIYQSSQILVSLTKKKIWLDSKNLMSHLWTNALKSKRF